MASATHYEHIALTTPNEPPPQYEASSKWKGRVPNRKSPIWKQLGAFLVLFCAGFVPLIAVTRATAGFSGVFETKEIPCGNTPDKKYSVFQMENATAEGWEAVFALDYTFGKFSFAEAKTVDVTWDVLVGRGLQLIFWYIGYHVFSDAILRVIERHPATYRTFTDLTLQGPSATTIWTLTKDLFRTKSRRTCWLFFFLVLSTAYILSVPVFVGAMTGYVNRAEAWVELGEEENIVPAKDLNNAWLIMGVRNITNGTTRLNECSDDDGIYDIVRELRARVEECDCLAPNGTLIHTELWDGSYGTKFYRNRTLREDCTFQYPNNNQTFKVPGYLDERPCNAPYGNVSLTSGKTYDFGDLVLDRGWCYGGRAVTNNNYAISARCLPSTDKTFNWGFSTTVSSVFVILNLVWTIAMYAVWQDAQINSKLVKKGFGMSPLRAAFVITAAAMDRTGLNNRGLLQIKNKSLYAELYGQKKHERATVSKDIFRSDDDDHGKSEVWLRKRSEDSRSSDA